MARSCCGPRTHPQVASWNGNPNLLGGGNARQQVVEGALDPFIFCALPRPSFRRPKPIVVHRISLQDPAVDAGIELLEHGGVGRILALRLEAFLECLGHGQRCLGADAGLDAELAGVFERGAEQKSRAVEHVVAALRRARLWDVVPHYPGAEVVALKELGRAAGVIAVFLGE